MCNASQRVAVEGPSTETPTISEALEGKKMKPKYVYQYVHTDRPTNSEKGGVAARLREICGITINLKFLDQQRPSLHQYHQKYGNK